MAETFKDARQGVSVVGEDGAITAIAPPPDGRWTKSDVAFLLARGVSEERIVEEIMRHVVVVHDGSGKT